MSRLILVCAFLLGMLFTASGVATAQETGTDVDIAAIGETVLAGDPESIVAGLEVLPDDADLPEGFINPPSGVSENADIVEEFTGAIGQMDGSIGTVNHAFDTDPAIVPGIISSGIVTYIVTDEEITAEDLDEFEEGASQGLTGATPEAGSSAATPGITSEGNVQRIDLGGTEAVLLTVGVELGGVNAVVQIIAVPVGNSMVIGTVLVADQGEIDQDLVLGFAEALTLTGVEHLGTVAAGTQ